MGRPSTYKPEYAVKVLDLGKQGMSECEMARELDVPRKTMLGWAGENERGAVPEFVEAFSKARDLAQSWWEEQARQGLGKRDFNPALWMKVMASRYRKDYSEKTIVEHQGGIGQPNSADVSEKELDRRLRQLLAKQEALQPNALFKSDDTDNANAQSSESLN